MTQAKRLPASAPALGRRAHLCLDNPMVAARVRLRTTHRRLRGYDPRRYGKSPIAKNQPLRDFTNGLLRITPHFERDAEPGGSCEVKTGTA